MPINITCVTVVMAKVGKCADPRNLPWPRDRSAAQPGQHGDRACTRYIILRIYHTILKYTVCDPDGEDISTIDAVQNMYRVDYRDDYQSPSSRQHKSNNNSSPTARANHNGPRPRIAFLGSCAIGVLDYIRSHVLSTLPLNMYGVRIGRQPQMILVFNPSGGVFRYHQPPFYTVEPGLC